MLLAVLAFATQTLAKDLAAADETFSGCYPMPVADRPVIHLRDALSQYEAISQKYGASKQIKQRISACEIACGNYEDAYDDSPDGSPEENRAANRLNLAQRLEHVFKQHVVQIVPEAADRYLVLTQDHTKEEENRESDTRVLRYLEIPAKGQPKTLDRFKIENDFVDEGCLVYIAPLRQGGPKAVLLCHDYSSDGDRSELTFFMTDGHKLKKVGSFFANEGAGVRPADARHPLAVTIGGSWKLSWDDAYEWSNGKFVFANAHRADLLAPDPLANEPDLVTQADSLTFADWETHAALLDIQHKFAKAKQAWIKAEQLCKAAVHSPVGHRVEEFYGDPAHVLKEIRQRIRWIDKHDYNHPLLYRPVDDDILAPPYKLGHAND